MISLPLPPSLLPSLPPFLSPSLLPSLPPFLSPSLLPSLPPSLPPSLLPSLPPSLSLRICQKERELTMSGTYRMPWQPSLRYNTSGHRSTCKLLEAPPYLYTVHAPPYTVHAPPYLYTVHAPPYLCTVHVPTCTYLHYIHVHVHIYTCS